MGLFKDFNKYKNNIAIIDNEYSDLTYKQVLKETNKIKKKIKNKSLILIVSENTLGSLLAYIFCIIKFAIQNRSNHCSSIFQRYPFSCSIFSS